MTEGDASGENDGKFAGCGEGTPPRNGGAGSPECRGTSCGPGECSAGFVSVVSACWFSPISAAITSRVSPWAATRTALAAGSVPSRANDASTREARARADDSIVLSPWRCDACAPTAMGSERGKSGAKECGVDKARATICDATASGSLGCGCADEAAVAAGCG